MKKRNVFLFGAGAAMPWGGPSTDKLTQVIRNSGFFTKDGTTRITDFIYTELLKNGYKAWEANFETIINVIEEFLIYNSTFNRTGTTDSIFKIFMEFRNAENLLNYKVHGERKHGYQLEIPPGSLYEYSEKSLNNETPEQMFFQALIRELLTDLSAGIIDYSYHTGGKSKIFTSENNELNTGFVTFMKQKAAEGVIRLYNLNYDRIFKVLLERGGVPIFEGFECGEYLNYDCERIAPNLLRILEDTNCHTHYNLHGCDHWEVLQEDDTELYNPMVYMSPFAQLAINNSSAVMQIERGRSIVVSNIITGYQKAQKSFIAPFKQMQSAFDRDLLNANTLYIIGYSFGDEHVNTTIRLATKHNPKLRIVIVDPAYSEVNDPKNYEMFKEIMIRHFSGWFGNLGNAKRIKPDHDTYFDGRMHVYTVRLQEFINEMLIGKFN